MCAVKRLTSTVKMVVVQKKKKRKKRFEVSNKLMSPMRVYSCVWLVRVALCVGMFSQTWRCMEELCMWACTRVCVCQYRPTIIRAASTTHTRTHTQISRCIIHAALQKKKKEVWKWQTFGQMEAGVAIKDGNIGWKKGQNVHQVYLGSTRSFAGPN